MAKTTYHLLTEAEPFSEFYGGAISRWTANVVRNSDRSVVVCPAADDSWGLAPEFIRIVPLFKHYSSLRRFVARLPWWIHSRVIRWIFGRLLGGVGPGDILWIHNRPEFAVALTPQVRGRGGRVVLHLHNAHLTHGPEWLMRQVAVDRLVFASNFLEDQARRHFPSLGASSVLYGGADESIFYPAVERSVRDPLTVLFAGRLVQDKGVHVLIDAMKLLEQQAVRMQAHIVGSSHFGQGNVTDYIRRLKAAAPATVTFLPYRTGTALGDLFRRADIFCSPAVWDEPFGLVNVEALASGLPVVASLSGGAGEIFSSGGGILVQPGSAVQLASALRRLAEDPDLRIRLGRQGYSAFRTRFTWAQARRGVEEIQHSLGRNGNSPAREHEAGRPTYAETMSDH